jgi:hypothetical protein
MALNNISLEGRLCVPTTKSILIKLLIIIHFYGKKKRGIGPHNQNLLVFPGLLLFPFIGQRGPVKFYVFVFKLHANIRKNLCKKGGLQTRLQIPLITH